MMVRPRSCPTDPVHALPALALALSLRLLRVPTAHREQRLRRMQLRGREREPCPRIRLLLLLMVKLLVLKVKEREMVISYCGLERRPSACKVERLALPRCIFASRPGLAGTGARAGSGAVGGRRSGIVVQVEEGDAVLLARACGETP